MPVSVYIQKRGASTESLSIIAIQPGWIPAYAGMTAVCSFLENALVHSTIQIRI